MNRLELALVASTEPRVFSTDSESPFNNIYKYVNMSAAPIVACMLVDFLGKLCGQLLVGV